MNNNQAQNQDPDFELVQLAQNTDNHNLKEAEEAFISLYNKYFKTIYGYFYNKVQNTTDSEDLTSETFLQVVVSIKNFQGRSSYKNWLFGIAKLLLIKYLKKKYQQTTSQLNENINGETTSIESITNFNLDNSELEITNIKNTERVDYTLSKLSNRYRQILELRFIKNYTIAETAEELKLTIQNVKVLQHRALKKANSFGM